jgi:hypothetical protein
VAPLHAIFVVVAGKLTPAKDLDTAIAGELARFEDVFGHHVSRGLVQFTLKRMTKNFVN